MSESVIGVFEELSKAREAEGSLNAISIPSEIYDRATFDPDAHEGGTFGYFSHLLGAEDVSADRYFKAFKQGFFILVANAQNSTEAESARSSLQQSGARNAQILPYWERLCSHAMSRATPSEQIPADRHPS